VVRAIPAFSVGKKLVPEQSCWEWGARTAVARATKDLSTGGHSLRVDGQANLVANTQLIDKKRFALAQHVQSPGVGPAGSVIAGPQQLEEKRSR